jgi:hypothetical protein
LNNNDFLCFSFCRFSTSSAVYLGSPILWRKKNNHGKKFYRKVFLGNLGEVNFKKGFENYCQKMGLRTWERCTFLDRHYSE